MEVRFRNPFYHNKFGLLGGGGDHDTIYTLPDDTVLPESAVVIEGESEHRKVNPPKRAQRKDGRFIADDKSTEDINEAYEADAQPVRKKPVEGKNKVVDAKVKKRSAK